MIEELTIRGHEALFDGHVDRSFPRASGGTVHHAEATLARTTRIDAIEAAELRTFYTARYEGDGVSFERSTCPAPPP